MAGTVKQGFPKASMSLLFLRSIRSALVEQQQLSQFFSGLTANQKTNLIKAFSRLTTAETAIQQQVQSAAGMQQAIVEQQARIDQLEAVNADQQDSLSEQALLIAQLAQRVTVLEGD